jgi:hypothetical protein
MIRLWRFTGGKEKSNFGVNPTRDELDQPQAAQQPLPLF